MLKRSFQFLWYFSIFVNFVNIDLAFNNKTLKNGTCLTCIKARISLNNVLREQFFMSLNLMTTRDGKEFNMSGFD